jgi:DNA polymerase-3 subunit alpha
MKTDKKQISEPTTNNKVEAKNNSQSPKIPPTPIPIELSDVVKNENEYLEYLVWKGADDRYGVDLSEEIEGRITYELNVIKKKGVAGYFLMFWNIVRAAREELGVLVGPGRGRTPGSIVAYCLRITDIDPIRYGLLFERFYSTQSKGLPDIAIDVESEGRQKVITWLKNYYGEKCVAHFITQGTTGLKYTMADLQRMERMPIEMYNARQRYIPENERHIGIGAISIIIAPEDISNIVPVFEVFDKSSGEKLRAIANDDSAIKDAGLVRIGLLGLNVLSVIKSCVSRIKKTTGKEIDMKAIPLDDEATLKIFNEGNTIGVFLFESTGMRMKLRKLKSLSFNDLIAAEALYRPGTMGQFGRLIDRINGEEEISYLLPEMEQCLGSTYGLTIYQEQIIQLSQILAGFTPGESAVLIRAICLRKKDILDWLEIQFMDGGMKKGHPKDILEQIWNQWKTEGCKIFYKSHSTCYTMMAFQTAYLKAHYPAEFMEILINQARDDEARMNELIADCQANGLVVEDETAKVKIGDGIVVNIDRKKVRNANQ